MKIEQTVLEETIEKKIIEMESAEYEFPPRFSKKDYILVAAGIIICLALIIIGMFL